MEQPAYQGPELTTAQARAVYAIRRKHPEAELTFHERTWGFIVELTRPRPSGGRKVLALARFATDGSMRPDMPLPLARPPVRQRASSASSSAQVSDSTS
jgi:hypothetical protein